MREDPISNVQWLPWEELKANDYNPNVVFSPELRLLERSILRTGWVQPVLCGEDRTIIDGFHRWSLTRDSDELREVYGGKLPVCVLPVDRGTAMLLTVRMNRAKGTHTALRMSALVRELVNVHGFGLEEIAAEIGATEDEVRILYSADIFKDRSLADAPYSRAWKPAEVKKGKANA